ncbi:MAG: TIGR02117 family protein [Microcoleus sp. PH2017_22_RUC_O_B]|uniref:TIGR02117 family protein n=1 Tax=unclassified Microcoleus TaxID=2642155 RepID=UPI001D59D35B|nr:MULTISPECIES: TIGR02117 family protein [unclassified Microcoleus]MCC3528505.1 TIGR02117 family protein [Microcoleus sp. PH2017_21_RUC_O_A]MCC3540681.1 TIGR02117 family protein [Microcoleus sp. PH2017_22_RUC_O_B]
MLNSKLICRICILNLCLIAVLAAIGYLTPRKWEQSSQKTCTVSVQVSNQGIHTEIIVPVKNQYFNWNQYLPLTQIGRDANYDYKYLSFGWGDRAFMLESPTSATINPVIAFNALFLPTPSTLHVQGYRLVPQNKETKCVKISGENYLRLVNFIKNTFQLDAGGNKMKISYGYHNNDSFYEAKGSYSILRNCNDWTAEALREAEINTPLWSTLSSSIMFHLNSGCQCRSH